MGSAILGLLIFLMLIVIGAFLIFRTFWLWYWKIDRIVAALETIAANGTPIALTEEVPRRLSLTEHLSREIT